MIKDFEELSKCFTNIYNKVDELNDMLDDFETNHINNDSMNERINDVDNFKYLLRQESFYNENIEDFIDDYLKFHNK